MKAAMPMSLVVVVVVGVVLLSALTPVQGQIPGGINDVDLELDDPVVLFALQQIRDHMNLADDVDLLSVVEAKSQVTDRVTYFLKLKFSGGYVCDIEVVDHWANPGLDVRVQPICLNSVSPRSLLGGVSEPKPLPDQEDPMTSSVLDALDAAVCAVGRQALGNKAFKISDTSGVTYTSQVTAGMTYRYYNVPLVETQCRQTVCNRQDLASCDTQHLPKRKRCDLEVHHTAGPHSDFVVSPDTIRACVDLD